MKNIYPITILILLLTAVVFYLYSLPDKDLLATCLTDKQVTLYSSNWCEHCQEQIELFGTFKDKLTIQDCGGSKDTPLTKECQDKKITRLPTWLDANGNTIVGTANLETLGVKFGCGL